MILLELREFLFSPLKGREFRVQIKAEEKGIFSGFARLKEEAANIGLMAEFIAAEGEFLKGGNPVFVGKGNAEEVARAEEVLLGVIGKPSGVATAAYSFVHQAKGEIDIVCGAWKKVPPEIRADLRNAIATGGAKIRITDEPFIYLDKNYIRMFGSIKAAVGQAKLYDKNRVIVVQLKGERLPIEDEAEEAIEAGADILMVDTGKLDDLRNVVKKVHILRFNREIKLAYAGGVTLENIKDVIAVKANIVDVGRAIIDAPLLDFSLDVISN